MLNTEFSMHGVVREYSRSTGTYLLRHRNVSDMHGCSEEPSILLWRMVVALAHWQVVASALGIKRLNYVHKVLWRPGVRLFGMVI